MSTLVIDYSTDGSEGVSIPRWMPPGREALVFRPGEGAFPDPASFPAVVHSGSAVSICGDAPFQDAAEAFVRRAVAAGVPQMGICYGHQLIVRSLLGRKAVRRNPSGIEAGWLGVEWSPAARTALGVPPVTRVFQSHFDEVISLPEGSEILAWSGKTLIQAFISRRLGLFGVQFHPEFDHESGNAQFHADRALLSGNGVDVDAILGSGPEPPADGRFFRFFLGAEWGER